MAERPGYEYKFRDVGGKGLTQYQYQNFPLSPSIAAELILAFFSTRNGPVKRIEIERYVEARHREMGGTVSGAAQSRVMTALRRLVNESKISNPSYGWYSLVTSSARLEDEVSANHLPNGAVIETETITPEIVIGDGSEKVYVYFSAAERKLANFENRDWWPVR